MAVHVKTLLAFSVVLFRSVDFSKRNQGTSCPLTALLEFEKEMVTIKKCSRHVCFLIYTTSQTENVT